MPAKAWSQPDNDIVQTIAEVLLREEQCAGDPSNKDSDDHERKYNIRQDNRCDNRYDNRHDNRNDNRYERFAQFQLYWLLVRSFFLFKPSYERITKKTFC